MAKNKKQSEVEKLQNVISTYTDYNSSLILTPADVESILALEDFERDLQADDALQADNNYDDLMEEVVLTTENYDSEQ